jgi:hypothetical protein
LAYPEKVQTRFLEAGQDAFRQPNVGHALGIFTPTFKALFHVRSLGPVLSKLSGIVDVLRDLLETGSGIA